MIHLTEANGNVRNIALAHKPLGENPLEVEVSEGATILLPWDRDKRIRPGDSTVSSFRSNFFELSRLDCYKELRLIAGWYQYNTVPDPFNTQKHLWVSSALPSTGKRKGQRRLTTLSVGVLEGLWVYELTERNNDTYVEVFINTTPLRGRASRYSSPDDYWSCDETNYNYGDTFRWSFPLQNLVGILLGELDFPHLDKMIEASYELNVRLMRQNGGGLYRRFHNELLGNDFLAASLRWYEA